MAKRFVSNEKVYVALQAQLSRDKKGKGIWNDIKVRGGYNKLNGRN